MWWGYHYLDWSNDIYRLTPEQIFDIEKRPLGEEKKRSPTLDNILSLDYVPVGIVQLMFNYGTVNINVGQEKFIFHGVYNPMTRHRWISPIICKPARRKEKKNTSPRPPTYGRLVDLP